MTTQSLYQKYRPHKFNDVIGQEEIVKTLQSQIKDNVIGHAYLFYGSRGLGKTSIARIMAAELAISEEDLYEIDAASNRGIDDIRDIRSGVSTKPFSSPYKMYLIDEVHMLTKEAFNALLKTLEEPPSHVIFVLATTELHKVPDTIQSRAQVFTFKQPDADTVIQLLEKVIKAEEVDISKDILTQIARHSTGSYRDSLTRLQTVISNPDHYTMDDGVLVQQIIDLISSGQPNLEILSSVQNHLNPKYVYQELLQSISDLLYEKISQKNPDITISSTHLKTVLEHRDSFAFNDVQTERAALLLVIAELLEVERAK